MALLFSHQGELDPSPYTAVFRTGRSLARSLHRCRTKYDPLASPCAYSPSFSHWSLWPRSGCRIRPLSVLHASPPMPTEPCSLHDAASCSLAPTDAPYPPSDPLDLDPRTALGQHGPVLRSPASTNTPFTVLRRLGLAPFSFLFFVWFVLFPDLNASLPLLFTGGYRSHPSKESFCARSSPCAVSGPRPLLLLNIMA